MQSFFKEKSNNYQKRLILLNIKDPVSTLKKQAINRNNPLKQGLSLVFLGSFIKKPLIKGFSVFFLILITVFPVSVAEAGFLSSILGGNKDSVKNTEILDENLKNSQNIELLQTTVSVDLDNSRGGGDINIENGALVPNAGPVGTALDIDDAYSHQISVYVVRKGDSLASIAKMFKVSTSTIIWANDLKNSKDIKEGDNLIILPVSGVQYTVKKGDTVASIAKKFKGDADDIYNFNNLSSDDILAVGDEIIIPDGEIATTKSNPVSSTSKTKISLSGLPVIEGYYMRPLVGGRKSQGVHGYNGVDIAAPVGTELMASASGKVIISRNSGWNGGYGKYVVISHDNGTQTLYAHMNESIVYVGQNVSQGQIIGYLGNTGKSTGPHIHFEIRGAKNPF